MANYLRPVLDAVQAVLEKYTPGLLAALNRPPFVEFLRVFTGQLKNPPTAWIMPRRTAIAEEPTALEQKSEVMVKIGVLGSEPEEVVEASLDYVKAVTDAVLMADPAADWGINILRVHPQIQDYGPLQDQGRTFARFPEVHLIIDHAETEPALQ